MPGDPFPYNYPCGCGGWSGYSHKCPLHCGGEVGITTTLRPFPSSSLGDEDIERIAQRVAELLKAKQIVALPSEDEPLAAPGTDPASEL